MRLGCDKGTHKIIGLRLWPHVPPHPRYVSVQWRSTDSKSGPAKNM